MAAFQPKIHENENIGADLNAHNNIWDLHVCPDDRGNQLAEVIIDAESGFLNNAKLSTRQDPATGKCFFPDVTIVHTGIQHCCDWVSLNALSSDHKPILTTVHLPTLQRNSPKRLVWDWKKGDLQAFTADLDERLAEIDDDQHNTTTFYNAPCTAILVAAKSHIGLKEVGMSEENWRTIEIFKAEGARDTERATLGIYSPDYKDLDTEVERLVRDRKTKIWKRKVELF